MNVFNALKDKVIKRTALVGTIGIGYVGRAFGEGTAEAGYNVIGYGRRRGPVAEINKLHISRFHATTSTKNLAGCDIIAICVPTPVLEDKTPDLTAVREAAASVARILRPGQLIVLESSVAPGTTRKVVLPILQETGLTVEEDFFLAFSPERIDPGNQNFPFTKIPKVVAGYGERSTSLVYEFYSRIVTLAYAVSSLETAEMAKILENTFRLVNISLVNELKTYTSAIGVDIWEVINAAKTKPFGFLAHYPGPGIGGHCIPVDPHYLREDAERLGIPLTLISSASSVNDRQPHQVAEKARQLLQEITPAASSARVMLLGIAYKRNVNDLRESPAFPLWRALEKEQITVSYHDPYIPRYNGSRSMPLTKRVISQHDLMIVVTDHSDIPYQKLLESGVSILDTRGVYNGTKRENLYHV